MITWQSCKWRMAWQWAVLPSFHCYSRGCWPHYFALLHGQMEVKYCCCCCCCCWPLRAITRQTRQVTGFHFFTPSTALPPSPQHNRRPTTSLEKISAEWPPFDQAALGQTALVALLRQDREHSTHTVQHSSVQCWTDSLTLLPSALLGWHSSLQPFFQGSNSPECEVYCLDHAN